jgi:hypothetical protein
MPQDFDLPDSDDEDVLEALIEEQHATFRSKQQDRAEQLRTTRIWSAFPSPDPVSQRKRCEEHAVLLEQLSGERHTMHNPPPSSRRRVCSR